VREKYPVPFGRRVAVREYGWRPKKGRRRAVKVEIGTPVAVPGSDWGCRLRITGLPTKIDRRVFGIDGVQALELALLLSGKVLASFVRSSVGTIEAWGNPITDVHRLGLPLSLESIQSAVEALRAYLKRAKTRRTLPAEWRDGVLIQLSNAAADLGAVPGRERSAARRQSDKSRG
jgi:hypothetical protein